MAKHLAIGSNVIDGTISFDGRKVMRVMFEITFLSKPSVKITLEDSSAAHVPYITRVKTDRFRIGFKTPYTGIVAWTATEI